MHVIEQQVDGFGYRVRHIVADPIGLESDFFCHLLAVLFLFRDRLADHPAGDTDDGGAFGDFLGDHRVGTDLGILVHGKRPQHLGAGTDHHTVLQGRMALALVPAGAAQGDTVVERHVIADFRGFADHHAHAVIDKEASTDLGTRVDLDTRHPAGESGNKSRQLLEVPFPQGVGEAVEQHGVQARVVQQHLQGVTCRRVPVEYRRDVLAYSIKHRYLVSGVTGWIPRGAGTIPRHSAAFFFPAPPAHHAECSFPFCPVARA